VSRSKFFINKFYNDVNSINNSVSLICAKERNRQSALQCKWNDSVKVEPEKFVHKICKIVCQLKCGVELRAVFNTVLKFWFTLKVGMQCSCVNISLCMNNVVYEARMMVGVSDMLP
jgi:hypothetical protein